MISNVDEEFREEIWIGLGINYDRAKLPASVIEARHDTERIPKEINDHYFSLNLSVAEFLEYKAPKISAEIIHTKPDIWFSKSSSHFFAAVLMLKDVERFRALEKGQAALAAAMKSSKKKGDIVDSIEGEE
ncbi:hypothetical protein CPC08DRAFT_768459 [Agrocybe pediades]|nr:hypothetical protein CPC08DRAFT_768459 [Agrocybe pediades]